MVATPYRRLIAREYLSSAAESPLTWTLHPRHAPAPQDVANDGNDVPIDLPFNISGLPQGSFLQLNGVILILTNDQGAQWDSGWQFLSQWLFPERQTTSIDLSLKRAVFDQMKTSPVKARLLLAFTLYRDTNQRTFVTPSGEFALPELGFCSAGQGYAHSLNCRTPLRRPNFLMITSEMMTSTCPLVPHENPGAPGQMAFSSIQNGDSSPAEIGVSPVHTVGVYLSPRESVAGNTGICPGTPLVLSNPEAVTRSRIELQFDNLSLADYQRASGLRSLIFSH
jgi:hypothetical protein